MSDNSNNLNSEVFIGREETIKQLFDNINNNSKSVTLLSGESGIGKSTVLDEFYRRLTTLIESKRYSHYSLFVGYYDKSKAILTRSEFLIYPFNIALARIIKRIKELQTTNEKKDIIANRLKNAFSNFLREEGNEIAKAIIEDAARKAGFENTFKIAKRFWQKFKEQRTSIMLGEEFVAKNKQSILFSYLEVFRALADEFKDRHFLLLFDQFEYVGKSTIDFLVNFIKFMPERFHVVIAYKTDYKVEDIAERQLCEDLRSAILNELKGKELRLDGLKAEEIGKWIKIVRGIDVQLIPDLKRIRENSAGLPILLNEWIKTSQNLDYNEIERIKLCEQVLKHKNDLSDEDKVKLYRLSVLIYPLKSDMLSKYLHVNKHNNSFDLVVPFIERLVERGIFDKNHRWFRHDIIRKCFEDELEDEQRHERLRNR